MIGMGIASAVGGLAQAGVARAGARDANATQRYIFDQTTEMSAPYREGGQNALGGMLFELGLGDRPENYAGFTQSPGYQFRLNEGQNALAQMMNARGLRNSGPAMKAATQYGQDYASGEYGNYFARLGSLAGLGQAAVANQAAAGQNYANAVGQNQMNAANATSGAIGNTLSDLSGIYGAARGGMFGPNPGLGVRPAPNALAAWGY